MGFYDGIEKVDASQDRGSFPRAGRYLALINRVRSGESNADSTDYAAVDVTIIKVLEGGTDPMMINPAGSGIRDWIVDPQGHHREGEDVGIVFMKKHLSGLPNYKAFLAAALDATADDVTGEVCTKIEEDQSLAGDVVELSIRTIAKRDGGPFTKVTCVRLVDKAEFLPMLSEAVIGRYFTA